jgi:hypothetical protein
MNILSVTQSGEQVVSSDWPTNLCVLANQVQHFPAKDLRLAFWTPGLKMCIIAAKMRIKNDILIMRKPESRMRTLQALVHT